MRQYMPTLEEYLDRRWDALSDEAKKILKLDDPENATFLIQLWSRRWIQMKEDQLSAITASLK